MEFGLIFTKNNLIMACKSCGQKNQLQTNTLITQAVETPTQQDCKYTLEQLENMLMDEYIKTEKDYLRISYLRSAINLYPKDCNSFSSVI